jgi:peptide/nickel transport system permease protein
MRLFLYVGRRLVFVIPQLVGIVLVAFILVHLIPGDPARLMLGPMATNQSIAQLRDRLGLDKPLPVQFWIYLANLVHGDLGSSWQTTQPVTKDLLQRLPATLELITYSLLVAVLIGASLGVISASRRGGVADKLGASYGMVAGALPDFWLGLVLIFIIYAHLHWAPAPTGRFPLTMQPPPTITGFYTIDSILTGKWSALAAAAWHLMLPVLTLGIVNAGPILKMTRSTMQRMLESDVVNYARMCGLPESVVRRYALRNALPPVITIISVLYGFLIGGAVLVEVVFSWGGAGQYAVQGVLNADFNPVIGFVLVSAIFSLVIYLAVDLIYFAIDPRIRH